MMNVGYEAETKAKMVLMAQQASSRLGETTNTQPRQVIFTSLCAAIHDEISIICERHGIAMGAISRLRDPRPVAECDKNMISGNKQSMSTLESELSLILHRLQMARAESVNLADELNSLI